MNNNFKNIYLLDTFYYRVFQSVYFAFSKLDFEFGTGVQYYFGKFQRLQIWNMELLIT